MDLKYLSIFFVLFLGLSFSGDLDKYALENDDSFIYLKRIAIGNHENIGENGVGYILNWEYNSEIIVKGKLVKQPKSTYTNNNILAVYLLQNAEIMWDISKTTTEDWVGSGNPCNIKWTSSSNGSKKLDELSTFFESKYQNQQTYVKLTIENNSNLQEYIIDANFGITPVKYDHSGNCEFDVGYWKGDIDIFYYLYHPGDIYLPGDTILYKDIVLMGDSLNEWDAGIDTDYIYSFEVGDVSYDWLDETPNWVVQWKMVLPEESYGPSISENTTTPQDIEDYIYQETSPFEFYPPFDAPCCGSLGLFLFAFFGAVISNKFY
ncbi:MAG: hypothetical protein PHU63_00585 [Candidatus ainarchaeum sp.]|nr:hypothetical protein [Candidatus ainarchaeum sp.]